LKLQRIRNPFLSTLTNYSAAKELKTNNFSFLFRIYLSSTKSKMKSLIFSLILFSNIIFLVSCKDTSPQPSDLVGNYIVTMSLRDGVVNTEAIKDSINEAMSKASEELNKAKLEMNEEFNFSDIDTTTSEGKIEYAAKKLGKTIAEAGLGMGELGKEMGSLFSGLAEGGIGMTKALLENMTLDVELQADGNIMASGSMLNIGLNDKTWKVVGDDFIIADANNNEDQILKISERSDVGFTLTKDDIIIKLVKK
jgi:hypothetical protein